MGYALAPKKHDWDAAWHLFVVGATHEEITKQLGIPDHLLDQYSYKHDWQKRRIAAREVARNAAQRDLTKRIEQNRAKHQHFVMDQLEESEEHISQLIVKKQDDSPFAIGMPLGQKLSILKQHDDIARRTYKLDEIEEHDPVRQGFALLVALQPNKQILVNEPEPIEVETSEDNFASGDGIHETKTPSIREDSAQTNGQMRRGPDSHVSIAAGNYLENVVELGPDFIPVKPLKEEASASSNEEKTCVSGIQVFPSQTEAFAGILSPFNGHINAQEEVANGTKRAQEPESGRNNPSKEQEEFNARTPREWQWLQAERARKEQKGKEEPAATIEQVSKGIKPLPKNLY